MSADRRTLRRARPLADLLGATLGPALAAQGFSGADIVASWPEIVGERLAAGSRPLKVEWPRRRAGQEEGRRSDPATLVIRVESALALELQHMAPVIAERINAIYGWRCVGRLVLKQGPVATRQPARPPPAPLSEAERQRIAAAVASIEDGSLRQALARLGGAMTAGKEVPDGDSVALPGRAAPLS